MIILLGINIPLIYYHIIIIIIIFCVLRSYSHAHREENVGVSQEPNGTVGGRKEDRIYFVTISFSLLLKTSTYTAFSKTFTKSYRYHSSKVFFQFFQLEHGVPGFFAFLDISVLQYWTKQEKDHSRTRILLYYSSLYEIYNS